MYADYINIFRKLPKEKAGELIMHILEYVNDNNPTTDDLVIDLCFEPIKLQLKRDLQKYEVSKFDKGRAGEIGNLKRWNPDLYNKFTTGEITFEQATEIAEHRRCDKNIADAIKSSQMRQSATNLSQKIAVTVNDTVNVTVTDTVNVKEKEDPAQIFQEAEILETTEYKPENGKEKNCAKKESFLPIEELENRFKNYEYQTWEFLMRNFAITREEYDVGVDLFLFEQKDNLEREYSDIHKHLKSFIKLNIKNIKSQNNGKPRTVAGIKVETIKRTFEALNADTD